MACHLPSSPPSADARTAPLSIPRRGSQNDRLATLLAETSIRPRKFSDKAKRKISSSSSSSTGRRAAHSGHATTSLHSHTIDLRLPCTPPGSQPRAVPNAHSMRSQRMPPQRRPSLFGEDELASSSYTTVAADAAASFQYLLTPPDSLPQLSRSYSSDSMETQESLRSSPSIQRQARIAWAPRQTVDLALENPLWVDEDALFALPSASAMQTPTKPRKSALSLLLQPLSAVGPVIRSSSLVASLSASLSAWAASLSAAQFDEDNLRFSAGRLHQSTAAGLRMQPVTARSARAFAVAAPKPVSQSGRKTQAALLEPEMERVPTALQRDSQDARHTAAEALPCVELQPWRSFASSENTEADTTTSAASTRRRRPREPRLNPDFLRILVLEQNMCRSGKLSGTLGYARMILAARQDVAPCAADGDAMARRGPLWQVMVMDA